MYRGHPPRVVEAVVAYHKAHEGVSRVVKISHAHKVYLNIDLTPDAHQELCDRYSGLVEQKVIDCEGVTGALDFLVGATGRIKSFVVSGTPQDELRRITDQRGLSDYFAGVYGSPRNKEDIVNELLCNHSLDAQKCLFIGDAMTDYNAAHSCDMPFLGRVIPGEQSPFPEGTQTVSDLLNLAQIVGLPNFKETDQ